MELFDMTFPFDTVSIKIRRLSLSDNIHPKYKYWIKYFTQEYQKNDPLITPPFSDLIKQFNFEKAELNVSYKNIKWIETDSIQKYQLSNDLGMTTTISQSYFEFCKQYNALKVKNDNILNFASPHLIRFIIAYIFQFEQHFANIIQENNEAGFPLSFVKDFLTVNEVMLQMKNETRDDYLIFLLSDFLSFLQDNLHSFMYRSECKTLNELVTGLVNYFISFLEKLSRYDQKYSQIISFLSLYLTFHLENAPFTNEYKTMLEKCLTIFPKGKELSKNVNVSTDVLSLITYSLNNIKKNNMNLCDFIKIGSAIMTYLSTIDTINIDSDLHVNMDNYPIINFNLLSQNIADYFQKLFSIFLVNEPVIQPNIEIKMDDNPYNFCNIVFISKQLVVPKPLSAMPIKLMPEVTPAIFKNRVGEYYNDCYHDISKLYNSFKLTLNKHNDLMANIIDYIMYLYQIDQLSISKHYFTMSVLVLCDPLELSNYFEKSSKWNTILNERAFVKMEKYDDDLIKMAEKIIINCFLYTQSIQFWLLETLFGLLFTCHMPYILNMLKYLFIHNKAKFIAIVKRSDSNLIDILYLIDGRIKSFLLKNDNSDLIEIRSSIFSMIYEFSQTEVIEKLIHDENKCGNLLSLSLELAIQPAVMNILQNALISKSSATISESIGGYFFASTKDIKQDRNWQNLIQLLMHSIEESLPKNSILICQSFLKSSLIESLNKIASESSSPEFCLKIFSFIVKMCCNSKQFSNDISTRKCNFYEIWKEILSKNRIENDTIDLLKKLTFLGEGTLIQNQEGLRLLVYLTKSTSYFSEMIKLLTQICEMSLINRYRCSIADLGSFLLDIFKENGDEMILNLIKTIGSSFLSPNELNSFIRFLKLNSSNPKVLSLLKTLNEIIINSSLNPEKTSFFHIEEKNYKFMLDSITLSDKISFSFSIRLDSQARNKKYLIFSLMNERQVISMMFDHLLIILNIGSSTFNIRAEISTNVWNTFYFNLNKHNVSLSMNNTKLYETKLPKKFEFNPPFVKFTMSVSICDLEDICFYENQKVVAHYSGKVEEDGICPNIAQNSDSFGAAQFIGMTVPYTLRIFNSISNIGGINIFLPLFYSGDKSCDKTQFILLLLQSICNIISKDENLFIEHQFFRTLSSLLPPETTTDIMSCFLEIYQTIKSQELKTEILIHIFGNWSLIKTFNDEVHRALLSKIYKLVANSDIQLFFKVNPVRKLILAFESILSNPDAIKNAWKFIESMIILAAQTHFLDEKDIMILFSATNNPNVVHLRNCLDAIDKLIRNTDLVNTYLEKHDYFKSLFHILSKNDNSLNASVFTLFNTISNAFPESSLSKNITYSFSLLRPNNETLNILSSFIFMESSNPPKIQNAHFIPYLCSIIYFYSSDKIQMTLDNVIGSLELDDDSAINMAKCENWPFWLLFLTNMDNKQQLWIKNIARISLVSESLGRGLKFEEIKQVFNVFAQSFDLRYDLMMKQFILSLIELDKNRHFGQQISTEIFQYIFFDHSIPLSNQDAFCIVKDNLVHFVQYVIHKEWLPSSFNFSLTVFNNYKMKDTFMQEFALKYCLEANKTFINESIVLSYEEIPVIYFVALLIHSISMAGNKDRSRSYFEKFLSIKSKQKSKKLLSFSFLDFKNETKLIKKHCDNNSEPLNLYLLMKEEALKYQSKFFEKTHNYIESLELVFKPIYDYDILNQNLPDIPDTNELLLLLQSEFDIKMRQNNSLCKSTLNDLKHTSILWSNSSRKLHWKTDNVIDIFGRKMKMKQNYDFDDHKDASAARNNDLSQNLEMSHNRSSFLELEDEVPDNDIQVVSIMHFNSTMVTLTANYKGVIHFTSNSLLFLSKEITNEFGQETEKIVQKTVEIPISSFSFAMKRRFLHKDIAAEVFTKYCKSYLFFFESKSKRRLFLKKMNGLGTKIFRAKNITEKTKSWKNGAISNYEYIYWLNMCSGRSYNDIAQYPVYPWVLSNYSSDYIDLHDVNNYRDLSKPIGSLNEERIEKLLMQYEEIKNDPCEACLYRVHYSTPGFVIYYLIRCEPFTSLHISLQQGRFDHPGRLFQSIQNSWESCISTNTDFRELIPEFYSSNEFLLNTEKFDLGDGINDVIIPKWANSAIHFIYLNRIALESPYVSKNIHKWIDLIFGCKQQDLKSLNLFHPFSDSRSMTNYYNDNDRLLMIMNHAANLGVIPSKLFSQAHSDREFIPLVPDFTNTQKLLFCVEFHDINAIKMWISPNNTISYIQIDGIVKNISSAQNEKGKLPLNISSSNPINVVAKVNMKLPIALAQREIVHNFISVIPGKKIIISSPWSGTFDIFDIKGNLHFSSDDEKANITAITADKNVIISSAQDASLTVWDLKSGYKKSYLHAHSHRISCIAYSSDIDLIVSADISGKLSYSSAISCKCERSMQLEVIPTHLKISNLGIVLVFYETEVSGSVTTTIESYDLSQRFIEACKISGKITASCICEFQDYSQYLFVTTSSLKVHLMCIFELTKRVAFGEITSPVECCVFHKEKHTLYLTQKNGILVSYRFVNYE